MDPVTVTANPRPLGVTATAAPGTDTAVAEPDAVTDVSPDRPWITIVWDDPINLMSYVTHVFMTVFGYPKPKATSLMLDVHERGKAVVSSGPRERMEMGRLSTARFRAVGDRVPRLVSERTSPVAAR